MAAAAVPQIVTLRELADAQGWSYVKAKKLHQRGRLPTFTLPEGRTVYVRVQDLEAVLQPRLSQDVAAALPASVQGTDLSNFKPRRR
ncbi:MAG: hypothetical protein AB7I08_12370 [Thermoleophilia bacterium]